MKNMNKILTVGISLCVLNAPAFAKTAKELNQKNRAPASERYHSDEYVISLIEGTAGVRALKKAYKPCSLVGVQKGEPNEHLVPKTVTYACKPKDGKITIEAYTEVAGWGETTDIKLTVTGIPGYQNE